MTLLAHLIPHALKTLSLLMAVYSERLMSAAGGCWKEPNEAALHFETNWIANSV